MMADHAYGERDPVRVQAVELLGARTALFVPMLKDGTPIGVIVIWRREVQAFSESQIQLLVHVRRPGGDRPRERAPVHGAREPANRELTEALEQQTATAEILRVISSSPTAVQPVFEAIAESAARLCEALSGGDAPGLGRRC